MARSQFVALLLLLNLLLLVGCQSSTKGQPELGQVTGRITLDGQPLADAMVFFMLEGKRESTGVTNKDGKYEIAYMPKVFGAVVGHNKVAVKANWQDEGTPEAMKRGEPVPIKYNFQTILTADVKRGKNTFDFDLKTTD